MCSILKGMQGRKLRKNFNTPGDAHEFTWSCYKGKPFFQGDKTCTWLADAIDKAREKYEFDLWAYVFMPNHVHLLIHPRLPDYDVATIKQAIKQPVSQRAAAYLRKYAAGDLERLSNMHTDGTNSFRFWQAGGGYDRNLFSIEAIRSSIDYLHNNPIRKGLIESILDWKWSSANAYHGSSHGPLTVDLCEMML